MRPDRPCGHCASGIAIPLHIGTLRRSDCAHFQKEKCGGRDCQNLFVLGFWIKPFFQKGLFEPGLRDLRELSL